MAQKLRVDWACLSALNPRLVCCGISGYGPVGSMRDDKGYDVVLQAFSGMISITGEHDGGPVRSPFSPVDQATGLHALIGILAALRQRDATGRGVHVDASLFDTADKPLILGVANDALWRAFCNLAGQPELGSAPRFASNASRVAHRPATIALTQPLLRSRPRDEWIELLGAASIPCAPIHSVAQPLRFNGQRLTSPVHPPRLNQDRASVLVDAGYTTEEIDTNTAPTA